MLQYRQYWHVSKINKQWPLHTVIKSRSERWTWVVSWPDRETDWLIHQVSIHLQPITHIELLFTDIWYRKGRKVWYLMLVVHATPAGNVTCHIPLGQRLRQHLIDSSWFRIFLRVWLRVSSCLSSLLLFLFLPLSQRVYSFVLFLLFGGLLINC